MYESIIHALNHLPEHPKTKTVRNLSKPYKNILKDYPIETVYELCESLLKASEWAHTILAYQLVYDQRTRYNKETFAIFDHWTKTYVKDWWDCDDFMNITCKQTLLGARHVHIDGAGNVFSGTCMGIILGKVGTACHDSLDNLWQGFDYREHPIVARLVESGPIGLMILAERLGYQREDGYASKCHLCYEIRRFLYLSGEYDGYIGPSVCYGLEASKNGAAAGIEKEQ